MVTSQGRWARGSIDRCRRVGGHGLEADFNRKGTSNYTDQIGQRVASELCSVIDDATLKEIIGALYWPKSPYAFAVIPAAAASFATCQ